LRWSGLQTPSTPRKSHMEIAQERDKYLACP
jgi:hypothetical protein